MKNMVSLGFKEIANNKYKKGFFFVEVQKNGSVKVDIDTVNTFVWGSIDSFLENHNSEEIDAENAAILTKYVKMFKGSETLNLVVGATIPKSLLLEKDINLREFEQLFSKADITVY